MIPHSQFQVISSRTVHQDQLRNIFNNNEKVSVIYAPSQQPVGASKAVFNETICLSKLLRTDLHPTTLYHPQANGLIEGNYPDLKASLKCRLSGPNCIDELPWVLFSLHTAPKEDLRSSSAELFYGSPLTVPGDFFPDSTARSAPQHLKQQRERVGNLHSIPTTAHGGDNITSHVPSALNQAKFIFVRHDARRTPLQTLYDGPLEVIERTPK